MKSLSNLLVFDLASGEAEALSKNVSHLIYADDLLTFEKADLHTTNNLISTLHIFNEVSNLFINTTKSLIYFSKLVDTTLQHQIYHISGFNTTLP